MLTIEQVENAVTCEDIFVNNEIKTKSLYKEFAKKYHPDVYREKDLTDLFSKLNTMYEDALSKIEKGIWVEKDVLVLDRVDGKKFKFKYLRDYSFELGKFYIGRNHIIYVLNKDKKKYYDNALRILDGLHYANSQMEKEFKRYFPEIEAKYELKDGCFCLVIKKTPDMFLLDDLNKFYKSNGKCLDSKHCAWIISRLNNLTCFLKYNNLVHNGLSLTNILVSPKEHNLYVFGGWWYCVPVDEKMIGTQKSIFDLMPVKEKAEKIATFKTDIESIRAIGRAINKEVPKPMLEWLEKGSSDDAFKEFDGWTKALLDSFGERKFIPLNISEKDIYKK